MSELRPYQADLHRRITHAWGSGHRNVLAVAPTGSGKTVLFSKILAEHQGAACAIAHRQELVSQISLSLAREGLRHSIIAPRALVRFIAQLHSDETGASFYDPAAKIAVAGVDTLIRRTAALDSWRQQVTLYVMDEAHHLLRDNKWGKAAAMFPHARGLGVTATPCRADGKGLGRHADGLADVLVEGPSMRSLINEGYLSDYTILAPPSDLDLSDVPTSKATGDWNPNALSHAVHRSHLVGDVVAHYKRLAMGKLGVTFATDVPAATELAAEYNRQGVPAAVVSAKTPDSERYSLVSQFRAGELMQLVNVDIFGEGFDLPALEVVSMARPTQSFALYSQQFGRGSRPFPGKTRTIIIDHVNNVCTHNGPPDVPRIWTLDRRESARRSAPDPDIIPFRICIECTQPYESVLPACPYCRAVYMPARRDGPRYVEGNLVELDAATLASMRGDVARIDETPGSLRARMEAAGASRMAAGGAAAQQRRRQAAQRSLRRLLELYGSLQVAGGRGVPEAHQRFYHRYGIDVLSAQALGRREAEILTLRIMGDIG